MTKSMVFVFTALFSAVLFSAEAENIAAVGPGDSRKAILVTGATSGIGRNIAEALAARGYFVYAGARKQSDMDALFSPHPKLRYMIVPGRREAEQTILKEIERLVQINHRQPCAYQRQDLIGMLDEALESAVSQVAPI